MFGFKKIILSTPKDSINYIIPINTLLDSERVLKEYSRKHPSNEGFVVWGGLKDNNIFNVKLVIAPKTESDFGRVVVSHKSNYYVVKELSKRNIIQIAQVHSHPTSWIDHSQGDSEWAAFKVEGLLSIVVPNYCKKGFKDLLSCGVHRFSNNNFIRLSSKYIKEHFNLKMDLRSDFIDLRWGQNKCLMPMSGMKWEMIEPKYMV